ncbi:hypothetical protein GGX14DRAFT_406975 [Mycena pura]|uniref:Uncharacterized protein n=1 Tax=Mycena pura TaxID=153505 RepID=A0AAD6XXP3_9AGAR|nr:hypothetical protein GGX14DRAFT_406975 [Mycena pura]
MWSRGFAEFVVVVLIGRGFAPKPQYRSGASADPLLCYWSYCPWGKKEISRYYYFTVLEGSAEVTLLMRAVWGRDGPGHSTDQGSVTRDLLGICGQAAARL